MAEEVVRSLGVTPTWTVSAVLTILVTVSFVIERSIRYISDLFHRTKRKPLFQAVEKMKDELMLLGFLSLLLTATEHSISRMCVKSSLFTQTFYPCEPSEVEQETAEQSTGSRKLLGIFGHARQRFLSSETPHQCETGYEPFVSLEALEQLHRFIFVMGITHIVYSCISMLLSLLKILSWRKWEDDVHVGSHTNIRECSRELTLKRQTTFVKYHTSSTYSRNRFLVYLMCFFRQFGQGVTRADYLSLRLGFVTNHNLRFKYDFHSYMVRSVEDDFKRIVGISAPLWAYVVIFMLANVHGSNLYFWMSFIPLVLLLLVGAKLQHVIAQLALENIGASGPLGLNVVPRDELFWFNKPELILSLIHFILFQNAFELASFLWFWWEFGYGSCFLHNHAEVIVRLVSGFLSQFLCSYSTLPLYAIVTQMGTRFKATLITPKLRDTIHGWGKDARRRKKQGTVADGSTMRGSNDNTTTHHRGSESPLSADEDENCKEFNQLLNQAEIEMSNSKVAESDAPLLGNYARSHSFSVAQPDSSDATNKKFARSFTQPQESK